MSNSDWSWVDEQEKKAQEERSKDYFNIVEGDSRFVLLSHFAQLPQVYEVGSGKYRIAVEGDTGVSIKGVCWVYQDGAIKLARMPYDAVVKKVRSLAENPDWDFQFPFPHVFNLNAKGAGTKEVEYSLTPSPKKVEIPQAILDELVNKPTPEEMVEKIKGIKVSQGNDVPQANSAPEYPDMEPGDIPW